MSFSKSYNSLNFYICNLAHFLKYLDKLPTDASLQSEDVDGIERRVPVGGLVADVLTYPDEDGAD